MKRLALAFVLACVPAAADEPDCAFRWLVSSPSGAVTEYCGQEVDGVRCWESGWHIVHLTTSYLHQAPDGSPYIHTTSKLLYCEPSSGWIFGDGFDSQPALSRWIVTKGASHG